VARRKARTRGVIKSIHSLGDDAMNSIGIGQDIVVPEAQHAKALRSQACVASLIGWRFPMLSAVRFNNQSRFKAGKVDDVVVDWYLPPESQSSDLPLPQ
jgi:hypothetical protein